MKKVLLSVCVLIVCLGLFGCTDSTPKTGKSTMAEMEQTEQTHQRLVKATPPPKLTMSAERVNLRKKLEEWNNENKISYIYLVSYGKVMAYYTVKGKVSSLNSKLTTSQQIIRYGDVRNFRTDLVIESPSLDGSYGPNPDGIFFWTTEGVYVEWNGDYMLATQPLRLTTPPELVRQIK